MPEGYLIRSKQQPGFRRCNRYFPYEGITIPTNELDAETLKKLKAEPRLIIKHGEFEALAEQVEINNTTSDVMEDIIEVIGMLDANHNEDDWAKDGKPKVEAIEGLLDKDISAAQRNQAWAEYQQRVK
ncbi:hypothetical protein [Spartinivicinus poritis]|uniref:Uncharacterized protein n=1 Tax=Spartinivicinus poritis TaxID=2994640 RepID=A0ABT5UKP9_9GAMM|nr:hypothetical protein [Spartinivicinus sp. A2-2]MDE1465614.1 hypothetical protein [Spartinivicinus sp. A2-2]